MLFELWKTSLKFLTHDDGGSSYANVIHYNKACNNKKHYKNNNKQPLANPPKGANSFHPSRGHYLLPCPIVGIHLYPPPIGNITGVNRNLHIYMVKCLFDNQIYFSDMPSRYTDPFRKADFSDRDNKEGTSVKQIRWAYDD